MKYCSALNVVVSFLAIHHSYGAVLQAPDGIDVKGALSVIDDIHFNRVKLTYLDDGGTGTTNFFTWRNAAIYNWQFADPAGQPLTGMQLLESFQSWGTQLLLLDTRLPSLGGTPGAATVRLTSGGATSFIIPPIALGGSVVIPGNQFQVAGKSQFSGDVGIAGSLTVNGVKIGTGAGTQTGNTAMGSYTLNSNTTGSWNTGTGSAAIQMNTSGAANSAFGGQALLHNTTGSWNTAVGVNSLASNTTSWGNTAIGNQSLFSNTGGHHNTATGVESLLYNTNGFENTVNGYQSGLSNTIGNHNAGFGAWSMTLNTTGSANVAVGVVTLHFNQAGWNNTALGRAAGSYIADGVTPLGTTNNSIYLGAYSRGLSNADNNSIVIGYEAIGEGANTTVIGNANTGSTRVNGNLKVGSDASRGNIQAGGATFNQPVILQGAAVAGDIPMYTGN